MTVTVATFTLFILYAGPNADIDLRWAFRGIETEADCTALMRTAIEQKGVLETWCRRVPAGERSDQRTEDTLPEPEWIE